MDKFSRHHLNLYGLQDGMPPVFMKVELLNCISRGATAHCMEHEQLNKI